MQQLFRVRHLMRDIISYFLFLENETNGSEKLENGVWWLNYIIHCQSYSMSTGPTLGFSQDGWQRSNSGGGRGANAKINMHLFIQLTKVPQSLSATVICIFNLLRRRLNQMYIAPLYFLNPKLDLLLSFIYDEFISNLFQI